MYFQSIQKQGEYSLEITDNHKGEFVYNELVKFVDRDGVSQNNWNT